MEIKLLEKPIIGERTYLGQAFDECFKDFPLLLGKKYENTKRTDNGVTEKRD